jgi:hypothetical protein
MVARHGAVQVQRFSGDGHDVQFVTLPRGEDWRRPDAVLTFDHQIVRGCARVGDDERHLARGGTGLAEADRPFAEAHRHFGRGLTHRPDDLLADPATGEHAADDAADQRQRQKHQLGIAAESSDDRNVFA